MCSVMQLLDEYGGMADVRLDDRLRSMVLAMAGNPARSFPRAFGTVAGAEAGYRFLRNPRVTPAGIMAPHVEQTWSRATAASTVLALEDTTELRFNGHAKREGLGTLMNDGQGFFLHAALLVEFGEHCTPLGIAAHEVLVRDSADARRKRALSHRALHKDPSNEKLRWHRVVATVADAAGARNISVIHVGDREADEFTLLTKLVALGQRFVIRFRHDRRTTENNEWISALLERAPFVVQREVPLSAKVKLGEGRRKNKRPRDQRDAKLSIRATSVAVPRDRHIQAPLDELKVNVVDIVELDPPEGEDAIHWILLTTEPISTPQQLETVVDMYRARWLIEEYWKALKTGCAYEERQLESRYTLENALALFMPIAWQMLRLRAVARSTPNAPAELALSPPLIRILEHVARLPHNHWGVRLPETPTAYDVLRAVARIGGHLPQNGEPGWLVLRRGLDDLIALERAAELLAGFR